jgi:hypothetical protein
MLGKFGLAVAALVLSAAPALAASCLEPVPPTATDGTKASEQQMRDAIADFKQFQAESDDYQSCLLHDLDLQKKEAAKQTPPKPLDPSVQQGVDAKVAENQRLKEKVGAELNASIIAYKQTHPK